MSEGRKRAHFIISGRVQGVFFRSDTRDKASSLGITGWVRNRPDGTVEVVAEGSEDKLRQMRKWCGEGPAMAYVDRVDEEYSEATGEFDGFQVVH